MAFTCISAAAAKKMMDDREVQIVDIRDPQSFANGHVPGALSINNNTVGEFVSGADSDKPVLVFCYHGHSSQGAADFFAGQGFAEVYSVDGGFEEWRTVYPVAQ
jgi:thiosulfate sulfurtransferase